jgi:CheY-like chemotaxis protein
MLGKYEQDIPTKLDTYLEKYFQYFGTQVKHFESVGDLKELSEEDTCNSYWIDIDKAKQNIKDAIHNIDKSKLVAIASVTSRSKIEELGIPQENVVYKPITINKIKAALNATAETTPKIIEQKTVAQETYFDAKILVTEDNIINQKLIVRILQEHGITTDIANNGLESFEKRRSGNYDLIFMDIQMPVMDGIEATHEILDFEEDEEEAHIPIVALTANALKGDRERFLAEGMDEYITKPIETTELLYILNMFLSHKAVSKKGGEKAKAEKEVVETPLETTPEMSVEQESVGAEESIEEPAILPEESVETAESVLIAKKYLLERRVLAKVLDNLGYSYTSIDDMDNLANEVASGNYDILFVDQDSVTDEISNIAQNMVIISTQKSKDEIQNIIEESRG